MNKSNNITREEMWAKQCLSATDIDYAVWERDKSILHQLSKICHNCTFVVDVYKCNYTYASSNFVDLLGYDSHKIETLEKQGDYLESRIHPDDRAQLAALQVTLSQFIYSLPLEQRNDYSNIYSFRILNAKQQYIRVTSRHQVLEQDRNGKAWLVIGQYGYFTRPKTFRNSRLHCPKSEERGILLSFLFDNAFFAQPH